ncbi:hypothetical protein HHI36_014638 [Cryptolaemus montrouzieri]|uniref:Uncharacterized protein n=1 Tax=Cryptolaemus montrouzieri TaxID=559131 RepID=A0ABD2N4D9_9CUCU
MLILSRYAYRKQSDDGSSEEEDFKLPRKSEKTLKIETRNQFENLMEEDIDEDHHPTEEEDKQVEGTRTTKTTTKSPAKGGIGGLAIEDWRSYELMNRTYINND